MSERVREVWDCECGRGPVVACAFKRSTSLLIRRIGDMGHSRAADWRCADCIADMAEEVAGCPIRPFHRDFADATAPEPCMGDCGRPVDRTLPDPIPEGYELMLSEEITGRALYCAACFEAAE